MFTLPSAATSLGIFAIASFFSSLWYGPGTLAMQRLAGPDAKATALAVALLVNSAIGLSLGPLVMGAASDRSEEHTSELQSLMRISYADFCLKLKIENYTPTAS